jgi:hypothetical protein
MARGQKFMDAFFFSVSMINLLLITHFFFFQSHLPTTMMRTHLPSCMINSRCEKAEAGEKWLEKEVGR